MFSKLFSKAALPAWAGIVVAVLAIVYALFMGGTTTQTFTGKNGATYDVKLVIPSGIIELIDKCDLKKIGDECPVAISLNVKMTKAPTIVEPAKPAATAPAEPPKVETPAPIIVPAPAVKPLPDTLLN